MTIVRTRPRRPIPVFVVTGVAAIAVGACIGGLLLPLLGLLGSVSAASIGAVPLHILNIAAVTTIGLILVVCALVVAVQRRHTAPSVLFALAALVVTLMVTVYPLVAVSASTAAEAGGFWNALTHIVRAFGAA